MPSAGWFRFASYNIASPSGNPRAGLNTILEAIGNEAVQGNSRPIDILALQEVQSQATTTQAVVDLLNSIYGSGVYSRGNLNGQTTGGGTMGVVYRTATMQLLSETAIGNASASGQPRQTLRYHFQPVGYSSTAEFYLYNSHYKADSDSTSQNRRHVEATAIRADADSLGDGAQIIYAGDFNSYASNELFYQLLLSPGNGQAFDPINSPGNWHDNPTFNAIFTQAPSNNPPPGLTGGGLDDRFDFQIFTGELTDNFGLDYVAGSYRAFGNNGSVPVNGNVNASTSTALPGLTNRTLVLDLLTTVSDHLPVVADYRIVDVAAPTIVALHFSGVAWTQAFKSAAGSELYGFPAQTGAAQSLSMPWNNVNVVTVRFSEPVVVESSHLQVRGINVSQYAVASFQYDAGQFVAQWTFSANFGTDRLIIDLDGSSAGAVRDIAGNRLAGSWTDGVSAFPTTGPAGVSFLYRFVAAVGDVDRNGIVRNADLNVARSRLFLDAGMAQYSIFSDINADGLTRNSDLNVIRANLFTDPPAGPGPNRPPRTRDRDIGGRLPARAVQPLIAGAVMASETRRLTLARRVHAALEAVDLAIESWFES